MKPKEISRKKNIWLERICVYLLYLSAAISIGYWAVAKYDVTTDFSSNDSQQYIRMSQLDFQHVSKRFQYRILEPMMVRLLDKILKHTSLVEFLSRYYEDVPKKMIQLEFAFFNILALSLTAYLLYYYCLRLSFSKREGLLAGYFFLTSFFVVTYYSTPMTDAFAALFMIAGFYSVLMNSGWGLALSMLLGMLSKETIFVIPLLILLTEKKIISRNIIICGFSLLLYFIYVRLFPIKAVDDNTYIFDVLTDPSKFMHSIFFFFREVSFYTLIENVQVFLFLWVLFFYGIFKAKLPYFLKRGAWLLWLAVLMPFVQNVSANGRVVFYLFPIVIPISLFALRNVFDDQ